MLLLTKYAALISQVILPLRTQRYILTFSGNRMPLHTPGVENIIILLYYLLLSS